MGVYRPAILGRMQQVKGAPATRSGGAPMDDARKKKLIGNVKQATPNAINTNQTKVAQTPGGGQDPGEGKPYVKNPRGLPGSGGIVAQVPDANMPQHPFTAPPNPKGPMGEPGQPIGQTPGYSPDPIDSHPPGGQTPPPVDVNDPNAPRPGMFGDAPGRPPQPQTGIGGVMPPPPQTGIGGTGNPETGVGGVSAPGMMMDGAQSPAGMPTSGPGSMQSFLPHPSVQPVGGGPSPQQASLGGLYRNIAAQMQPPAQAPHMGMWRGPGRFNQPGPPGPMQPPPQPDAGQPQAPPNFNPNRPPPTQYPRLNQ